jgi:hypothetical protein
MWHKRHWYELGIPYMADEHKFLKVMTARWCDPLTVSNMIPKHDNWGPPHPHQSIPGGHSSYEVV